MRSGLFYIGVTHQSAPLAIRENLRADRERQLAMLSDLTDLGEGRMLLVTCERFEVYATTLESKNQSCDRKVSCGTAALRCDLHDPAGGGWATHASAQCSEASPNTDTHAWIALLSQWFDLPAELLRRSTRTLTGSDAANHMLRVAAGLESRIVGERQILGQVRNAFQFALEQDSLDAELAMLARTAIRTGKRVRHETLLGSGGRSIVTVAMDWLAGNNHSVADRTVGIVGSGRLAALVAAEVAARRPGRLLIVGRNEARAAEIGRRFGGVCVGMAALAQVVAATDMVITCTASPSYLIDPTLIGAERTTPLLLIDLSVPRNVDPAVVRTPGVTLGHLDEMVTHRSNGGAPGWDVIRHAEQTVKEELGSFHRWQRERQAAPAIAKLYREGRERHWDSRVLHDRIMRLKAGVMA